MTTLLWILAVIGGIIIIPLIGVIMLFLFAFYWHVFDVILDKLSDY